MFSHVDKEITNKPQYIYVLNDRNILKVFIINYNYWSYSNTRHIYIIVGAVVISLQICKKHNFNLQRLHIFPSLNEVLEPNTDAKVYPKHKVVISISVVLGTACKTPGAIQTFEIKLIAREKYWKYSTPMAEV